jgi:lipopolysaccharide transport system permease protein
MQNQKFTKIISNKPRSLLESFFEIFSSKFIIYSLLRKNIIISYSQSFVGPLYFFLLPLLQAIVFNFFLNSIFETDNSRTESFIFILISMTFWSFFSNLTIKCANSYFLNKKLISRVYFDRLVFFIQSVVLSTLNFSINFILALVIIFLFYLFKKDLGIVFSYKVLLLPIFIFYSCLFSLFIGIIIASVSIKLRDLLYGLGFAFQMILFISPVLYSLEKLNGLVYSLMIFNPVTFLLEGFRWFFYANTTIDSNVLLINIFYFVILIFTASRLYKKSNLILSDQI